MASGRWVLAILTELADGALPYMRLLRAVNEQPGWGGPARLSERVLSENLRRLEDADLVARNPASHGADAGVYAMTPAARALLPALGGVDAWAAAHPTAVAAIRQARTPGG